MYLYVHARERTLFAPVFSSMREGAYHKAVDCYVYWASLATSIYTGSDDNDAAAIKVTDVVYAGL
jgi:hypothetical protein